MHRVPSTRIRPLRVSDAEAVARLAEQLGYPATARQIAHRMVALDGWDDHALFGADEDGRMVGWIHVQTRETLESDPIAEITGLVVDAARRGSGVGRALVAAAEAWARARRLEQVRVRSNVVREGAHRFYQRLGYAVVKSQKVFARPLG